MWNQGEGWITRDEALPMREQTDLGQNLQHELFDEHDRLAPICEFDSQIGHSRPICAIRQDLYHPRCKAMTYACQLFTSDHHNAMTGNTPCDRGQLTRLCTLNLGRVS